MTTANPAQRPKPYVRGHRLVRDDDRDWLCACGERIAPDGTPHIDTRALQRAHLLAVKAERPRTAPRCKAYGCDRPQRRYGLCAMHSQRFRTRNGDITDPPSFEERFWARVDKQPGDACWVWLGNFGGAGYGSVIRDGKRHGTHRVAYELTNGPIPAGLFVCHHCDNRACVRPDHLFVGTAGDNSRDMRAKGRHVDPPHERPTHCKQGHELTPENTIVSKKHGRRRCRTCQEAYMAAWRAAKKAGTSPAQRVAIRRARAA